MLEPSSEIFNDRCKYLRRCNRCVSDNEWDICELFCNTCRFVEIRFRFCLEFANRNPQICHALWHSLNFRTLPMEFSTSSQNSTSGYFNSSCVPWAVYSNACLNNSCINGGGTKPIDIKSNYDPCEELLLQKF